MTEAVLQSLILRELQDRGICAWRQNTGAAKTAHGFVRFGIRGQADITAVLPGGRACFIEVKSEQGRLTPDQKAFGERITRAGGIYIVAKHLDDVVNRLPS